MIEFDGAVNTISWYPSAAESFFAMGTNNVMVPADAVSSCVSSATTALPAFKNARIDTPSATPAVRYVNVSGTFLADVAMTIGKWSIVKYSGSSVVVVSVVIVLVDEVDVDVVSVDIVLVVTVDVDVVTVVTDDVVDELVVVVAVDDVIVVPEEVDVDDCVTVVLVVCVCQHLPVLPSVPTKVVTPSTFGKYT